MSSFHSCVISFKKIHKTSIFLVVAGVASLGGTIAVGVGSSLLLVCHCVGIPPPRTVWYHKHNIITHHPRFTRNHDDSLLINSNVFLDLFMYIVKGFFYLKYHVHLWRRRS